MHDTQAALDEHEFLTGMIHTARTSLAGINGYTGLLAEATSEAERIACVLAIRTELTRLVWTVDMMLKRLRPAIPPEMLAADENTPV